MSKLYVDEIHPKTSGGAVTRPDLPAIFVQGNNATNTTVPAANVLTPANFTTSSSGGFAQGGMSYSTSTGEIIIPVSGVYKIYGQFYVNAAAQSARIAIKVNNNPRALAHRSPDENQGTVHTEVVLKLNANDRITFISGYTTTIYFGYAHTFYTAYLVG